MLGLLMGLIVLCVILGIAYVIIQQIPLPPNVKWIVYVVMLLIALFAILNYLPADTIPHGRWG